jgi:hypothetical protein
VSTSVVVFVFLARSFIRLPQCLVASLSAVAVFPCSPNSAFARVALRAMSQLPLICDEVVPAIRKCARRFCCQHDSLS